MPRIYLGFRSSLVNRSSRIVNFAITATYLRLRARLQSPFQIDFAQINQDDEGVFVKPSVVVEVTYQEIQETDEYTSGYALRVPKVVRFRPDKKIEEIGNVGKMSKLYEMQYERLPFQSL